MANTDFTSVLLIALGLSADCFVVALGGSVSLGSLSLMPVLRTALVFGCFQTLMPVLGWLVGHTLVGIIGQYDHWVAFGLLAIVGGRMIWESFRSGAERGRKADFTRGLLLVTMAVATSIDALAVGLSFAFLQVNIVLACLTIGVVAFVITGVGFVLGQKAGQVIGKRAELIGGIILIGIGLRIVLSHILD